MKGKNLLLALFVAGGISSMYSCGGGGNAFDSLADKNSTEACRFQVSQDLDKGRYDAVLSSACATRMDRGAAYFGKAGFDINDVIDRLIEAGGKDDVNSIDIYIKTIVPDSVNEETLKNLNLSLREYDAVINNPQSQSSEVKAAKFYISIVNMVKGITVMKVTMPPSIPPSISTAGTNVTFFSCDINNNGVPDDVDAVACALEVVSNNPVAIPPSGTCNNGRSSYTTTTDFQINKNNNLLPGVYRGITVNVKNFMSNPPASCGSTYKLLLYKHQNEYRLATTDSRSECTRRGTDEKWPCPIIEDNKSLDFVNTISDAFINMADKIIESIASTRPDIREEIERIKRDACSKFDPNKCEAEEIRDYINKITTRR